MAAVMIKPEKENFTAERSRGHRERWKTTHLDGSGDHLPVDLFLF